jgi:hypothetical protein
MMSDPVDRAWEPTLDEIEAAATVLVTLADTNKAATWRDGARLALIAARKQGVLAAAGSCEGAEEAKQRECDRAQIHRDDLWRRVEESLEPRPDLGAPLLGGGWRAGWTAGLWPVARTICKRRAVLHLRFG